MRPGGLNPLGRLVPKEVAMPVKKVSRGEKKKMTMSDGVAAAMQAEIEGHEFYKLMATKSQDEGAREMFASLARDEAEHHKALGELYGALAKDPHSKPPKMSGKPKYTFKSPIFSKDFLASRKKKNLEMSALSIGILLEQNAIVHYRAQSEAAEEAGTKKFFLDLVKWEGEHLRTLMAQKQFLQREVFAQARFEPF